MGEGDETWQSRKDQVREAYYRLHWPDPEEREAMGLPPTVGLSPEATTTPEASGDAAGNDASSAAPSTPEAVTSASASTDTLVTGTEQTETPPSPPSSTTPASSTRPSSGGLTDLTTPLGFVDGGSQMTSDEQHALLASLGSARQSLIQRLAEGTGQPIGAIVQQIAEFFVENEDERAEIPLAEAVAWYLDNQLLPEPTRR